MSTPSSIGPLHHVATPATRQELDFLRANDQETTASTIRYSYGGSTSTNASESEDSDIDAPTLAACSRAIVEAVERMATLARQPRTLAVAIAYDACLDIVTAAVNHMNEIETEGALHETVVEACRALRRIRALLLPSPPVRRTLRF